jgi:microcin C transport system substrate-binding protein
MPLNKTTSFIALSALLAAVLFGGCSKRAEGDKSAKAQAAPVATAATAPLTSDEASVINAFYKSKPQMFIFATPADLPKDLAWQDGHDEKPFADPRAVRGGTMTDYMTTWPPTLRFVGPDANNGMRDVFLDYNKMSLADMHPITRNWIPMLATAWAVSKDRRTVYFHLDPDATYSDGAPVKADDYFYTFYFNMSPFINDPWYNNFYGEKFTNITKYDDYTISITLTETKPDPVYYATLSPTPSHFYRVLDDKYLEKFQWKFEPTTGPWELKPENFIQGSSITMTRVKNWWANDKKFYAHRYNPDKRRYVLIREVPIACESFKKGDLDTFILTNSEYWYDRTQDCEAVKKGWIQRAVFYNETPQPTIGFYLNRANPILADKRVRQGIQYATNWQRVIDFYYRGDYRRLKGEVDGYRDFDSPTIKPRPFDVDKARALFAEAGFTKAGPDGILMNDKGQRLSFAVTIAQSPREQQAVILKEEALKAGLELNLDVLDPTSAYKKVMNKQHEITFWGWSVGGIYPRFWETYHSVNAYDKDGKVQTNSNNLTSTADPELDAMIEKFDKSTNLDEMKTLAHKMEEYLYDEASFVPGYAMPFYRLGYWGWIKFPEGFDVPTSDGPNCYGLYWIDQDAKKRILDAKKKGEDLGEKTLVFGKKTEVK